MFHYLTSYVFFTFLDQVQRRSDGLLEERVKEITRELGIISKIFMITVGGIFIYIYIYITNVKQLFFNSEGKVEDLEKTTANQSRIITILKEKIYNPQANYTGTT